MATRETKTECNFRQEIEDLREKHNLSVAKVARADEVDMNSGTLYSYLQGHSEMTSRNLEKVLNYLRSL